MATVKFVSISSTKVTTLEQDLKDIVPSFSSWIYVNDTVPLIFF